jgi:hypothetical protein
LNVAKRRKAPYANGGKKMSQLSQLDPTFWYVINHKYKHLVYRSKDRARAKQYAQQRNLAVMEDDNGYTVVSGSQLQVQGLDEALKSPAFG